MVDLAGPGLDDPGALANALVCDLGPCPLTNTMPIRRLRLLEANIAETELVMAWVEVPSLRVLRSDQVYRSGPPGTVLYRSRNRGYAGELEVDTEGLGPCTRDWRGA